MPLVRRFRRVALEERDGPAVGEELDVVECIVWSYASKALNQVGSVRGYTSFVLTID